MIREQRLRVEVPMVLALGSNLGDREATIRDAVAALAATPGIIVTAASSLVESAALKPHGVDESAPAYLNAVVIGRSALAPDDLLDRVNEIERGHGRVRAERWGDRTLDIDIVSLGGVRVATERLTVPHPRAFERSFVLAPWLEVAPKAELPGHGSVAELLAACSDHVRVYAAEPLFVRPGVTSKAGGR